MKKGVNMKGGTTAGERFLLEEGTTIPPPRIPAKSL